MLTLRIRIHLLWCTRPSFFKHIYHFLNEFIQTLTYELPLFGTIHQYLPYSIQLQFCTTHFFRNYVFWYINLLVQTFMITTIHDYIFFCSTLYFLQLFIGFLVYLSLCTTCVTPLHDLSDLFPMHFWQLFILAAPGWAAGASSTIR